MVRIDPFNLIPVSYESSTLFKISKVPQGCDRVVFFVSKKIFPNIFLKRLVFLNEDNFTLVKLSGGQG